MKVRPAAVRASGTRTLFGGYLLLVLGAAAAALADREMFGGVVGWWSAGTGIAALTVILLQFLSSGRFGWLTDGPGIDRTMRFHQLAGRLAMLLAAAHAGLAISGAGQATLAEWFGAAVAILSTSLFATGVGAFALLLALVVLGVLRKRLPWPYELWRGTHLAGAIAVAALALHHAFAVGVTSRRASVAVFWFFLGAVAAGAVAWVHLVKPLRMKRRPLRVARNAEIAVGIREIVLEPAGDQRVYWRAGQFAWLLLGQRRVPLLDHPFSIASSPRVGTGLRFLVKARGDFTRSLGSLPVGAPAWIDGPFGHFTLEAQARPKGGPGLNDVALFAGGIGIAPILGLLEELEARGEQRRISLVYGVAEAAQLVDVLRLAQLRCRIGLRLQVFVEAGDPHPLLAACTRRGRPDRAAIEAAVFGEPAATSCFVCGPPAMMREIALQLRALGVPARNIVSERFEYD